jgi:hypothetical protein
MSDDNHVHTIEIVTEDKIDSETLKWGAVDFHDYFTEEGESVVEIREVSSEAN